jgi:hypothetical protein
VACACVVCVCVCGVCMWQQRAIYRGMKDTRSTERSRWQHEDDRVCVQKSSMCVRAPAACNTHRGIQDTRSTEYIIQNTQKHTRHTEHTGYTIQAAQNIEYKQTHRANRTGAAQNTKYKIQNTECTQDRQSTYDTRSASGTERAGENATTIEQAASDGEKKSAGTERI